MLERSKALIGLAGIVCVALASGCAVDQEEENGSTSSSATAPGERGRKPSPGTDAPGTDAPGTEASDTATSTPPGPTPSDGPVMVSPVAGQTLGLAGAYTFKVQPSAGSQGTLCALRQDGKVVWENHANDGTLGKNGECGIHPDHPLHARFHSGKATFIARDLVSGQWTSAREIEINLVALAPTMAFPQAGQTLSLGGSYIFKMHGAAGTDGALCSIWQNGKAVWENYANDRTLGKNGECALHPDNPRYAAVRAGAAKFVGRYLVHGEWSQPVDINLTVR